MRTFAGIGFLVLLSGFGPLHQQTTCSTDNLRNTCVAKLSEGFNFLKSYAIDSEDGSKQKVEYSYVFTRGTQYMINLCTEESAATGIVINLLDGSRNKVASSNVNGQRVSVISFPCNATGIYYIQYIFDSKDQCGGSALGFRRTEKG